MPWFEVHSENYFADGGPRFPALDRIAPTIRCHQTAWACHSGPLTRSTWRTLPLKRLADRIDPARVSEHLCWSSVNGRHYNDLLPLPYTHEALDHICARVGRVQDFLGREILVENVSSYFAFPESTLAEAAFVAEIAARAGCKLLVDVNNIYVNARNHGIDADAYLAAIPSAAVGRSTSRDSTPAGRA